jgi:hypothetical protein
MATETGNDRRSTIMTVTIQAQGSNAAGRFGFKDNEVTAPLDARPIRKEAKMPRSDGWCVVK